MITFCPWRRGVKPYLCKSDNFFYRPDNPDHHLADRRNRGRAPACDDYPRQQATETGPVEESPYKGKTGLRRVLNAIGYSVSGLASAFRNEDAFRQELLLAAVLIPCGLWFGPNGLAKAMLVGSVLLVLIVELLNSAIEAAVDRVSLDRHSLAKRAKDIGSAAVFLSITNALVVWCLILA